MIPARSCFVGTIQDSILQTHPEQDESGCRFSDCVAQRSRNGLTQSNSLSAGFCGAFVVWNVEQAPCHCCSPEEHLADIAVLLALYLDGDDDNLESGSFSHVNVRESGALFSMACGRIHYSDNGDAELTAFRQAAHVTTQISSMQGV